MIRLEDNSFACQLRNGLEDLWFNKGLSLGEIDERLNQIEIPEEYHGDMLRLADYRKYERITNSIELLLERYVHRKIVKQLLDETGV